jgi:hypothetical protein
MTRIFAAALVASFIVVTSPCAAAPLAETLTGEAKTDFEAGKVLFEDGDFAGAASKFQQAHDRSKDPRLLWNVAVCEKAQRHYVRVQTLVERYLAEGKDVLTAEQVQAARAVLDTIKPFIGTARIETEEGVEVSIDGERTGTTPLAKPVPLDLGKHQLTAQKAGYKPFASSIVIEGGTETAVPIALVRVDPRARIAVHAGEGDSIAFDGVVVGVTRWQGDANAGPHTLRVSAPKRKTYELSLDLAEGSNRTVEVTLENESRALWPFIAGGVLLAGAATVGAFFLFKPDDKPGEQTPGSLAPGLVNLASVLR